MFTFYLFFFKYIFQFIIIMAIKEYVYRCVFACVCVCVCKSYTRSPGFFSPLPRLSLQSPPRLWLPLVDLATHWKVALQSPTSHPPTPGLRFPMQIAPLVTRMVLLSNIALYPDFIWAAVCLKIIVPITKPLALGRPASWTGLLGQCFSNVHVHITLRGDLIKMQRFGRFGVEPKDLHL